MICWVCGLHRTQRCADHQPPRTTKRRNILSTLRREIEQGRFPERAPMPSDPALMERFGVSRSTISSIMLVLVRDGLVIRERGSGTRVSARPRALPAIQAPAGAAPFVEMSSLIAGALGDANDVRRFDQPVGGVHAASVFIRAVNLPASTGAVGWPELVAHRFAGDAGWALGASEWQSGWLCLNTVRNGAVEAHVDPSLYRITLPDATRAVA